MSRLKAFSLHFVGSALVMLLIFALVRWVWYPGPLFFAANGLNLLGIIIPVDMVLGPLITLIIFAPHKKEMIKIKRDMAVILLVQITFAAYGVFSIFSARPVYMALVEDKFALVTANEVDEASQKKVKDPHFKQMPLFGPEFIGVNQPQDKDLRENLLFANAIFGMGVQNMPEFFKPYSQVRPDALRIGKPWDKLPGVEAQDKPRLQTFADQRQGQSTLFVTMYSRQKMYVAIDGKSGDVLTIL